MFDNVELYSKKARCLHLKLSAKPLTLTDVQLDKDRSLKRTTNKDPCDHLVSTSVDNSVLKVFFVQHCQSSNIADMSGHHQLSRRQWQNIFCLQSVGWSPSLCLAQVWRLAEDGGLASASPLGTVSSLWPGMQRTPDAGSTWTNGLTYFFSGEITFCLHTGFILLQRWQNIRVIRVQIESIESSSCDHTGHSSIDIFVLYYSLLGPGHLKNISENI